MDKPLKNKYTPLYKMFSGEELKIAELIQRRRLQILVHACLYYGFNTNLVPDSDYDKWENELVKLQNTYPEIASIVPYAEAFKDWDGSTGAYLPYYSPEISSRARHLLESVK